MCTVTYVPVDQGFILTSNRDESPEREMALTPALYDLADTSVIYPKDPRGGGSWICTGRDYTLCLLNGADSYHEKAGPYKHSRGLVVMDFFSFSGVDEFVDKYSFEGIEQFTLVIVPHNQSEVFQLRWNGLKTQLVRLDAKKEYIWSSFTLYPTTVIEERRKWFDEFKARELMTAQTILDFHRFGGTGDPENDLVMSRHGRVMTVSITQIRYNGCHEMDYHDLRKNSVDRVVFPRMK